MPLIPRSGLRCFRTVILALVATCVSTLARGQTGLDPGQPLAAWAVALSTPITLGISSSDRSILDEDLRRLAEVLARNTSLTVELASTEDYAPEEAMKARREPTLVALDSWDSSAEDIARRAGVDAMFVITSASARNGKTVKKKYTPVLKDGGDKSSKKIDVQSLLYRFDVDVRALERAEGEPNGEQGSAWIRVSQIEREGERSAAPMYVSASTKKVEWDLVSVVGKDLDGHLTTALGKISSQWPADLRADNLGAFYGSLDEDQKVEFWRRAERASPVKVGLPVDDLLALALAEWSRAEKEKGPWRPGTQSRSFVGDWIASCRRAWPLRDQPGWLTELMSGGNSSSDHAGAAQMVEELLTNFRHRRPMGVHNRRLPYRLVLAPEDVGLSLFTQAAPDPVRFYCDAAVYSEEEYDRIRKSKSRWLRNFDGVQVIQTGSKVKTLLRQPSGSLDPIAVMEFLYGQRSYRWPGESR
ncbi:hypothetical protein [Planctomycetes bacterium Poly30]